VIQEHLSTFYFPTEILLLEQGWKRLILVNIDVLLPFTVDYSWRK